VPWSHEKDYIQRNYKQQQNTKQNGES